MTAASESYPAITVGTKYEVSSTRVAVKTSNPNNALTPAGELGWTVMLKDTSGRTCAVESYSGPSEPTPGSCSTAGSHGGRTSYVYSAVSSQTPLVLATSVTETIAGTPSQTRQRRSDALGNLTQVIEDPTVLNYSAAYVYDPVGRLTQVTQGTQTRGFTYSTAGWLLSATNPETGTINYDYTPGGRLLTRTEGYDANGANGVTTCMGTFSGSGVLRAYGWGGAGR